MAAPAATRRLASALLGVLLILALVLPLGGSEAQTGRPARGAHWGEIEPGVVLVRFKAAAHPARAAGILAAQGAAQESEIRPIRVRKLRVPPGREREVAARLSADPDVEFAEVSAILYALWSPNDYYYVRGFQWNLPQIEMPRAWNVTLGSASVRVALIDTGIDTTHPDRPANVVLGRNYPDDGYTTSQDPNGHGTHVAGIVAARTNNGEGVAGVAPGATVLAIRVLDWAGNGWPEDVASATIEAADSGARAINLSLGSTFDSTTLRSAVAYAQGKGALVIAAAGNSYLDGNPVIYPAAYPGVLAVAATTVTDARACYSEVGSYVGVAAPGGDYSSGTSAILSLCPVSQGSYCWKAGTSMAAPHVAGLAALVWSVRPDLSAWEVGLLIKSTANRLGRPVPNEELGYGRVDAGAALELAPTATFHRVYLPLIERASP